MKIKNISKLILVAALSTWQANTQNNQLQSDNDNPKEFILNSENRVGFNADYESLLTLEMASRIAGFEASKANKMHTMKNMVAETLRYYWENGREVVIEGATFSRVDRVQLNWVDDEADMDSFLRFINVEKHPELIKINGVGERAYWNPNKNYLELYYMGISFRIEVDVSNDDTLDKEKTIALAKLIIKDRIK